MKKLCSIRYLTLWCFVLFLAAFFLVSLRPFASAARNAVRTARGEEAVAALESGFNEALPKKTLFVTINGGFCRILGERAVNERYRLDNGQLTYVIPETEVEGIADNTIAFAQTLQAEGIPFFYVSTPFKTDEADKQLPVGVEDYANENADRFLTLLRASGVEALDLREREKAEGLDHYSLFYPTDHHWTAETGFWAFQEIAAYLAEKDPGFTVDGRILDPEQYERTVYPQIFLGSHGRRVGPWYAGMDDLTVITPRFDTRPYVFIDDLNQMREGSFAEVFLFPEELEGDPFTHSRYDVYLGGEYGLMRMYNDSRAQDLPVQSTPKRLMVFKDSFSLVVAPFLALGYDEVEWLDLRLLDIDVMAYIRDFAPDAVLVLYNPGALEDNNRVMFDFLAAEKS